MKGDHSSVSEKSPLSTDENQMSSKIDRLRVCDVEGGRGSCFPFRRQWLVIGVFSREHASILTGNFYYRHGSFQPIEHESLGSFHWEIMNPTEAGHQWTMKGLIEQLNRTNQSLLEQNSLICEIKDWFDILYKRLPQVIFNSMGMPPIVKRKNIHGKHNAADRKSRKSSNLASLISNYGFHKTQIRNPSPWPTFAVIRRD